MKLKRIRWLIPVIILLLAVIFSGFTDHKTVLTGQMICERGDPATFYLRALDADGELKASGTGFCITEDGMALTAAHVIKGADAVHAVLPDGKEITVTVVSSDSKTDVAVLRLPKGAYPHLELETEIPVKGEPAYALGYPTRTAKIVSDGVVSMPVASINGTERLLLSAELASGMSGGPVLCEHGFVIGLNAATLRTMNGVSTSPTTQQLIDAVAAAKKAK